MSTLCMLLHLSALIALMRGLSMSSPRCPYPVFCMYLSVEACLSPSLPFAVFALRLVGCDNVCCSSLVLSITAGSGRFPAVNSQSIYVPFGLVNSKKKKRFVSHQVHEIHLKLAELMRDVNIRQLVIKNSHKGMQCLQRPCKYPKAIIDETLKHRRESSTKFRLEWLLPFNG